MFYFSVICAAVFVCYVSKITFFYLCLGCRLSERNCVEIVQCLVELKLIEVVHTTDGKEYLTPNELGKEIREELTVRGGTITTDSVG